MKSQAFKNATAVIMTGSFLLLNSSCGGPAYVVTESTASTAAPGSFTAPPKVDILLVGDNTGSMYEVLQQVEAQTPTFLAGLEAKGWNFHFSLTPLTWERKFNQIYTSKHDPNWGALWEPPYLNATTDVVDTVSPSVFSTSLDWVDLGEISNTANGDEPGLQTVSNVLSSDEAKVTGFLRDDALLVVILVSNGNDTSGLTYSDRGDGIMVAANAEDISAYQSVVAGLKADPSQIRFYAVVANKTTNHGSCLGGNSDKGTRYQSMAGQLGGTSFDICTQTVSSILDSISALLTEIPIDFTTKYLFLPEDAEVSTIKVTITDGPTGSTTVFDRPSAAGETTGWSYLGLQYNLPAIVSPVEMNYSSGYVIELHGGAALVGTDKASVDYKPAGARDAAVK